MFQDRKKLKQLRQELAEIDREYDPQFRAASSDDEYHPLREEYDQKTEATRLAVEAIRTGRALRKAEKWGLELPIKAWGAEGWDELAADRWFLTDRGIGSINRQASRARFNYWKEWAGILTPILSFLVAIIALLKK